MIASIALVLSGCSVDVPSHATREKIYQAYESDIDAIQSRFASAGTLDVLRFDQFKPQLSDDILAIKVENESSAESPDAYKKNKLEGSEYQLWNKAGIGQVIMDGREEKCLVYKIEGGGREAVLFIKDRSAVTSHSTQNTGNA
ncbi:MAG: hypothetical protein WC133_01000 [Candidatus Omnitrophota bacterium]